MLKSKILQVLFYMYHKFKFARVKITLLLELFQYVSIISHLNWLQYVLFFFKWLRYVHPIFSFLFNRSFTFYVLRERETYKGGAGDREAVRFPWQTILHKFMWSNYYYLLRCRHHCFNIINHNCVIIWHEPLILLISLVELILL